jgi:hypothetical protein
MSETQTSESNLRKRSLEGRDKKNEKLANRKVNPIAVGVVDLIAATAGINRVEHVTAAKSKNATEIVQPGEGLWSVADRAETEHGSHPDQFSIAEEVNRLEHKYGTTLHSGQEIEVHVK